MADAPRNARCEVPVTPTREDLGRVAVAVGTIANTLLHSEVDVSLRILPQRIFTENFLSSRGNPTSFVVDPTQEKFGDPSEDRADYLYLDDVRHYLESIAILLDQNYRSSLAQIPDYQSAMSLIAELKRPKIYSKESLLRYRDELRRDAAECAGTLQEIVQDLLGASSSISYAYPDWMTRVRLLRPSERAYVDVIKELVRNIARAPLAVPEILDPPLGIQMVRTFINTWVDELYRENSELEQSVHQRDVTFEERENLVTQRDHDTCDAYRRLFNLLDQVSSETDSFHRHELLLKILQGAAGGSGSAAAGAASSTGAGTSQGSAPSSGQTAAGTATGAQAAPGSGGPGFTSDGQASFRTPGSNAQQTTTSPAGAAAANAEDLTTLEKFRAANVSYTREIQRMRSIVFTQFLRVHGIDEKVIRQNPALSSEFRMLENQFFGQLEVLLQPMSIEQISDLSKTSGRLNLALKLYPLLSSNPNFLNSIQQFSKSYISSLPEEVREQVRRDIDRRAQNITGELEKDEQIAQAAFQDVNLDKLAESLQNQKVVLSPDHFSTLLDDLGISATDQGVMLHQLGSVMVRRWSPETLKELDRDHFAKIFGITPPTNPDEFQDLKAALAGFMLGQQVRIQTRHNKNTIVHFHQPKRTADGKIHDDEIQALHHYSQMATSLGVHTQDIAEAAVLGQKQLDALQQQDAGKFTVLQRAYAALRDEQLALFSQHLKKAQEQATLQGIQSRGMSQQQLRGLINKFSFYEQAQVRAENEPLTQREGQYAHSHCNSGLKLVTNHIDEGIGTAAFSFLGPEVAAVIPKSVRQGVGKRIRDILAPIAAVLGTILAAGTALLFGNLAIGAGLLLGGLLGFFFGPAIGLGVIGGTIAGGILGAIGGGILSAFGGAIGAGKGIVGGTAGAVGGTAAGVPATVGSGIASTVAVVAGVGIPLVASLYNNSVTTGAFLALPTVNNSGQESQYIVIEKHGNPGPTLSNPGFLPTQVTYTIKVKPRPGYKIQILSMDDHYTAHTANADLDTPPDPKIDLTAPNAHNSSGSIVLDSASNDEFDVPAYQASFDQKYNDSNVTNTVKVTFKAYPSGSTTAVQENGSDQLTAQSFEVLCFGKCPQTGNTCWPADGVLYQFPYSEGWANPGTHAQFNEDAFDITVGHSSDGVVGEPVRAPYSGTACLHSYVPYNTWALGEPSYGISVTLQASTPEQGSFTLLFGHLQESPITFSCQQVKQGDELGKLGNTGYSSGPHLHYEALGSHRPSLLKSLVPDGQNVSLNEAVRSTCPTQ